MSRSLQVPLERDLSEVLFWTNWIERSSRVLSFPRPPLQLLTLFVVQSVELAHSLSPLLDDCVPQEVIDGHIRGYLLDRIWSYHLTTNLVQRDLRAYDVAVSRSDSRQLLKASRKAVAAVMLSNKKLPAEGTTIRNVARRGVLAQFAGFSQSICRLSRK